MKRQEYILKIDNPCGQDWASMSQNSIGKFCAHCSKTVVDFTNLSDNEVIKIIENTSGKLCGRLTNQQLNKILRTNQSSSNSRLYRILAGLMLVGATNNSVATNHPTLQTEISPLIDKQELSEHHINRKEILPDSSKNIIQGVVLDAETKEPLIYASITVKDTKVGVATDQDGKFRFEIPDILLSNKIILVVSYFGYEKRELVIKQSQLPMTKEILVIPSKSILTGEVIIIKKRK